MLLMNNSPLNIFQILLLLERYNQNNWVFFGATSRNVLTTGRGSSVLIFTILKYEHFNFKMYFSHLLTDEI